jgi:hypothetical protein
MLATNSNYTVVNFFVVQFDLHWDLNAGAEGQLIYTATENAEIVLVHESPAGIQNTYWFVVGKGLEVWISNNNIASIPAKCVRSQAGDGTTCAQKG